MHMLCTRYKTLCPRIADLQILKKGTGKPKFFGRFPAFFAPNNYPQAAPAAHYIQTKQSSCPSGSVPVASCSAAFHTIFNFKMESSVGPEYLRGVHAGGQRFIVGRVVDIQLPAVHSGAHILHGVDGAVNQKLGSQRKQVQIRGDRVIRLGRGAGVGQVVSSGTGVAPAVTCDGEGPRDSPLFLSGSWFFTAPGPASTYASSSSNRTWLLPEPVLVI